MYRYDCYAELPTTITTTTTTTATISTTSTTTTTTTTITITTTATTVSTSTRQIETGLKILCALSDIFWVHEAGILHFLLLLSRNKTSLRKCLFLCP